MLLIMSLAAHAQKKSPKGDGSTPKIRHARLGLKFTFVFNQAKSKTFWELNLNQRLKKSL